jgi:hypothetical protein
VLAVVENGTVSHFKKFANFLINLKIIKIIIIKNKKYKNLKKLKGWSATPLLTKGVAIGPSHPFSFFMFL